MKEVVILRSSSVFEDSRCTKWIKTLTELNYNVSILSWDRKECYKEKTYFEIEDKRVPVDFFEHKCSFGSGMINIFKMLKFQKWLKGKLKIYKPGTIVHACDYDTASAAYPICKKNKLKLVYDIFDFYADTHKLPFPVNKIILSKDKKIINNADAVIICTEDRANQIGNVEPKKLVIIHNTPDIKDTDASIINKKLRICFIGSLGADRLLTEIFSKIHNYDQFDYVFGGVGLYEETAKLCAEKNKNVKYLGQMKYADVLKEEKKCDILFATYNPMIPNHKYSAPNKFYEAGALNKPVIVCKNTGVDKLVEKYNTGLVIDYNAESFFNACISLDKDRETLKLLGDNGKKAYNDNFSWEVMKDRIKKLYEQL